MFTPFSFETFAVQDPCANFIVGGIDLSTPPHPPLDFSFVSGDAGGFNTGGVNDISKNGPLTDSSNSTVKVPAGNRLNAIAGSYTFKMRVTDASSATSDANYTLSIANPTITSIDPSYIYDTSVVNINITGTYFIRDSDISFNKGSNTLTQNEVSYNNITSLTVKDVSAGSAGQYDISLANGSVIVNVPSVVLNIFQPVIFTISSLTFDTIYFDQGGTQIGGPSILGETLIYIKGSTSGNITFSNIITSINCKALIVGGGGPGGFGHGGGGAGGAVLYRTDKSITNNTSYLVTIGQGGTATSDSANYPGGSTTMFGVTATGGGAGANEVGDDGSGRSGNGGNGANGGGGCYTRLGGTGTSPTASGWTVYAGYNGGDGASTAAVPYGCGGGGGAGGAGESSTAIGGQGGDGANGIQINIDGNNYYWGAGGGGVTYSAEEPIGSGGSGNGGLGGGGGGCSVIGTPGTGGGSALNSGENGNDGDGTTGGAGGANTGSGGGGGANENGTGGPGGSGIVIIRFPSYVQF